MDAIKKIEETLILCEAGAKLSANSIANEVREVLQTLASTAAEVQRLREALTEIVETKASEHGTTPMMLFRCIKIARAALTNQQPE